MGEARFLVVVGRLESSCWSSPRYSGLGIRGQRTLGVGDHLHWSGGSLSVANPDAKALSRGGRAQKYRVRGVDLLDWARTKGITVPQELASAVFGDSSEVTSEATRTKEYRKRDRLWYVREFSKLVYQRACRAGMDWGG